LRGLPLCEEFVHLSLAFEIEPEKDSLQFPLEMPAMPPWSSPQSRVKPSVLT
jgi:hypothetical protein